MEIVRRKNHSSHRINRDALDIARKFQNRFEMNWHDYVHEYKEVITNE
jgi:hypothetical protein